LEVRFLNKKGGRVKISVIIFAIVFLFIGVDQFIEGADLGSRFYYYDNIFVKVMGCLFITISVALAFRKRFARKGIILLCLISIIELVLTLDFNSLSGGEIVVIISFIGFIYLLPIIFFSTSKVKGYFEALNYEDDLVESERIKQSFEEEEGEEQSSEKTAKFKKQDRNILIISLVNIIMFVAMLIMIKIELYNENMSELTTTGALIGVTVIVNAICSIIGTSIGISGIRSKNSKKTASIWGTVINSVIVSIYVLFGIIGLLF
jgi:hypothetical protein